MKPTSLARFGYFAVLASSAGMVTSASAAVFSDDFDTDTSAQWNVNASGAAGSDRALFAFDYSSVGIPSAPNSVGGTTRGLVLQANRTVVVPALQSGISVSPIGQHFTGDYVLRFDLWQNFNGPAPLGGSGSTQISGAGIQTAGTTPQWAGAVYDSIFFGGSADGGSSIDYRVYAKANAAADGSGYYAAGTEAGVRNNTHAYYANFGQITPPAAQTALFAQQTGATAAGALGFQWHDVEITKVGNLVTWEIDGKLLASVDTTGITFGGDNILLTYFDINATKSADPNADSLLFGLYDNVQVTPVPEPAAFAMVFGGLALVGAAIRRRNAA